MRQIKLFLILFLYLVFVPKINSQHNKASNSWISIGGYNLIIDFRKPDSIKLHNLGINNFKQFPVISKDSLIIGIHNQTSFDTLRIIEESNNLLKLYHYTSRNYFELIKGVNVIDSNLVNSMINNNNNIITLTRNGNIQNYEIDKQYDFLLPDNPFDLKCSKYELRKRIVYTDIGTVVYLTLHDKQTSNNQNYTVLIKEVSNEKIKGVLLSDNSLLELTTKKERQQFKDKVLEFDRKDIIGNYAIYFDHEKFNTEINLNRSLIHVGYSKLEFRENNSYAFTFKGESESGRWRIQNYRGIEYIELISKYTDFNGDERESKNKLFLISRGSKHLIFESPSCNLESKIENRLNLLKLE